MSLLYIFPYIVKPYQLNDAGNNTPADSAQTLTSGESTAINNSGTPTDSSENSDGKEDQNTIENIDSHLDNVYGGETVNSECDIEAKPDHKLVAFSSTDEWKFWFKVDGEKKSEIARLHGFDNVGRFEEAVSFNLTLNAGQIEIIRDMVDEVERNNVADIPVHTNEGLVKSSSKSGALYDESASDSNSGGRIVVHDKTTWTWTENIEYEDSRAVYLHHGVKYRLDLSGYKADQLREYAKNCFSLKSLNERHKRGAMKQWSLKNIIETWHGELVRSNRYLTYLE